MILQKKDRVVFLGDSLTRRTGLLSSTNPAARYGHSYLGSYVDILLKRLLVHFPHLELETLNAGVGGIMLPHLLQRLPGYLDDFRPTWAVLFMGQNDAKKYGPETFESYLIKVLEVLRNARVSTLQLSTTPHPGEAQKNQVLSAYDRIIESRCREFGNRFVDVKTPFEKLLEYNAGAEHAVRVFADGCHLAELGNQLLADLVFAAMTSQGPAVVRRPAV